MKKFLLLLLAAGVLLSGCVHEEADHREVVRKLDAINAALTNQPAAPVRWAFANKNEITTAIFQWSNEKMEQFQQTENLSADIAEKVHQYETLEGQLSQMRMGMMRPRFMRGMPGYPPGQPGSEPPATDKEFDALSQKVAEARAPVTAILERREHQAAQYRNQFPVDQLIADYVKGRYDLVVDSNEKVLYRSSGEVPDITEGVLMFFREKAK